MIPETTFSRSARMIPSWFLSSSSVTLPLEPLEISKVVGPLLAASLAGEQPSSVSATLRVWDSDDVAVPDEVPPELDDPQPATAAASAVAPTAAAAVLVEPTHSKLKLVLPELSCVSRPAIRRDGSWPLRGCL